MSKKVFVVCVCFVLAFGMSLPLAQVTQAAEGVSLYTPLTGISATPGETINYTVEIMNDTSSIRHLQFEMRGLPEGWESILTSGGRDVQQLSVKPDDVQEMNLEVQVPLEVKKDTYTLTLVAQGSGVNSELPLKVTITEAGTAVSDLSVEQPNLQGDATSTFDYKVTLRNRTADEQNYALTADVPRGWGVTFQSGGNNVTSVNVPANSTQDIDVSVTPPENVQADTYTIPIKAATGSTTAEAELEAVITGTYSLELSTPSERLNADVTAGGTETIELEVTNSGSAAVSDIQLSANAPSGWEVTFDQQKINNLEAGQSEIVKAKIAADREAIAGDYVVTMTADSPDGSAEANIRVSVKTSLLWGFVGILLIAAVIGGVIYLIRTYGRR